jgi:signal transduction histidine kinase
MVRQRLEDASEQWASTFEFMKDPVMVLASDRRVLRSNMSHDKGLKCFQLLGLEAACPECPMSTGDKAEIITPRGQFSVQSHKVDLRHDDDIFIHHYKDVSRERLLYSQVVQNQKMAAVGLLAGNIAHELSNPLAGIKSLIETVKLDLEETSEHLNDFDEIRNAAMRCQKIIENLLSFAFDEKVSDFEEFDALEIVQRTLPLLKVQLREHHIDVEESETKWMALGRISAFQQVIFNLLNNAGQAMKQPGTIRVQLSGTREAIKIRISDTGSGIPESLREKIFEPFFTTKKVGDGTGLGLSVARNLMREMGGDLELVKGQSEGATFEVTLKKRAS